MAAEVLASCKCCRKFSAAGQGKNSPAGFKVLHGKLGLQCEEEESNAILQLLKFEQVHKKQGSGGLHAGPG